jgi:hypothetical protein
MAQSADAQANAQAELGGVVINPFFAPGAFATEEGDYTNINRNFPNAGMTPLPHTNGFFTAPTPDSSFKSIRDILHALSNGGELRFSRDSLKDMAKGGDVTANLYVIRDESQVPRVYTKGDSIDRVDGRKVELDEFLVITIEKPLVQDGKVVGVQKPEGILVTGFVDSAADDGDTTSLQVIGAAGLKAMDDGNNYMVITAEGAHRMVTASGWGIGFYGLTAGLSDTGKYGTVAGGGPGYSSNQTGPEDKPWIQGYVGIVK